MALLEEMNNQDEPIGAIVYRLLYNTCGVAAILYSAYCFFAFIITDDISYGIKAILFMLVAMNYKPKERG